MGSHLIISPHETKCQPDYLQPQLQIIVALCGYFFLLDSVLTPPIRSWTSSLFFITNCP
ncbi:hypothetical protein DAI22_02g068450 [Oryza sativa Japonica Group]|nr:hypothetical protein DAI22_02g068450 [Oryza sativa Japonica Group]